MNGGAIAAVLGTLVFPGLGQGMAAHRIRAILWAVVILIVTLASVLSVWFLPISLVARIASAVDAYRCVLRHAPPHNWVNVAIVVVVGAVGAGYARLALEAFKIPSSSMYPTLIIGDHVYVDKLTPAWNPIERGEIIVFPHPCSRRVYIKRVIALGGDTVEVRCSTVFVNGVALAATQLSTGDTYYDYDENTREWYTRQASRFREVHGSHAYDTYRSVDPKPRGDFPERDRMLLPGCSQGDFYDRSSPQMRVPVGRFVQTRPTDAAQPCDAQLHYVVPPGTAFVMGDNRHNANDSRYWGVVPMSSIIGRAIGIWMSDGKEGGWGRFGAIE